MHRLEAVEQIFKTFRDQQNNFDPEIESELLYLLNYYLMSVPKTGTTPDTPVKDAIGIPEFISSKKDLLEALDAIAAEFYLEETASVNTARVLQPFFTAAREIAAQVEDTPGQRRKHRFTGPWHNPGGDAPEDAPSAG